MGWVGGGGWGEGRKSQPDLKMLLCIFKSGSHVQNCDVLNMLQTAAHMWEWVWAGWGRVRLGWGFFSL